MGINKFRQRVDIMEVTQGAPDGIGGFGTTKTVAITVWGRMEVTRSSRTQEGQAVSNIIPLTITIRSGSYAVSPDNILRVEGKEFTINSVRWDEYNRWTICECNG